MSGPITGDSLEVVTFDLAGEVFAIEALLVREILDLVPVTEVPNSLPWVGGLINVRGKVVPLADLRLIFGQERTPYTLDTRIIVIEIDIDGDPTYVGMIADKVHEVTVIEAADMTETPRIGLKWDSDLIRCIGKYQNDFIVVIETARLLERGIDGASLLTTAAPQEALV